MRRTSAIGLGLMLALSGNAARAEPAGHSLRLLGAAPSAQDPAPSSFALDLRIKPGDGEFQSAVEGWFASIVAPAGSGEVSGSCVEKRCALTLELSSGKLALTGDILDPAGEVPARFVVKDDQDKAVQTGTASLGVLTGTVPGLGALAAPDAINGDDLDDLLMWGQQTVASGSPPGDGPPAGYQRESVGSWQSGKERLATGLIFEADLAELKADRAAAEKVAGWTTINETAHGWTAGYPGALLPVTSSSGAERRFASADGKAVLTIAIDPPKSSDAFDAFVESVTGSREGRSQVNITRTNGDLQARYEQGDIVTVAAYHNRDTGFARIVYTYPVDRAEAFEPFDMIVQREFKVTDEVKP